MSKITNQMRADCVEAALKKTFAKREATHAKNLMLFADSVYAHSFGEAKQAVSTLPSGWVSSNDTIYISANGFDNAYHEREQTGPYRHQKLSSAQPMPAHIGSAFELTAEHPCFSASQLLCKEFDKLKDDKATLGSKLRALLFSVKTFKQLEEAWPEGKKFYPEPMSSCMAIIPVTLTLELNEMLGIK